MNIKSLETHLAEVPVADRYLFSAQLLDARIYGSTGDESKARLCVHRFRRALIRLRGERITGEVRL